MKTKLSLIGTATAIIAIVAVSCKRDVEFNSLSTGNFTDTAGPLKSAATFPIGLAIDYALMKSDPNYAATIAREAGSVTFGYQMKHGAIVKDDGSFDYSKTDELFNIATTAGLQVYGHTLAWHQNQNGNYLRSLTVGGSGPGATNVLTGGDFEAGSAIGASGTGGALFTGWNCLVGGTSAGNFAVVAGNNSAKAMQANVTTPGANAYDMQVIGTNWTAVSGHSYKVTLDIKSSVTNGKVRLVMQNAAYQQFDITPTTGWATYTWTLTLGETSPILRFNFPNAGTYWIDNVTIVDATTAAPPTGPQIAAAVDTAMSRFIRNTVTRYAGRIKAWDVVNEAISDGTGTIRNNPGTTTTGDIFYWSQYLGRDYALKAFQYAKAADPTALLFINDYNLESDNTKLDSLIAFVNELKGKGAKVDGIGTQMHISMSTSYAGIENMFKKLAATGLKIRISELDVRINLGDAADYKPTPLPLAYQAAMYKYVVDSYLKNIPAAQQYGITIWGITDKDTWYVTSQHKVDFPLLFDSTYKKKPAYSAVLQGLKRK